MKGQRQNDKKPKVETKRWKLTTDTEEEEGRGGGKEEIRHRKIFNF